MAERLWVSGCSREAQGLFGGRRSGETVCVGATSVGGCELGEEGNFRQRKSTDTEDLGTGGMSDWRDHRPGARWEGTPAWLDWNIWLPFCLLCLCRDSVDPEGSGQLLFNRRVKCSDWGTGGNPNKYVFSVLITNSVDKFYTEEDPKSHRSGMISPEYPKSVLESETYLLPDDIRTSHLRS
nr:ashwin isoform X3 [Gorilla gorilla gorilla]